MSNEITVNIAVVYTNGYLNTPFNVQTLQIDQSTPLTAIGSQIVGTTAEALNVGDVATLGVLAIRNIDATNYITWGPDSSGTMIPLGRIRPGEGWIFRLEPGVTMKLKANGAPVTIDRYLLND